ncbi:MAG: helix-turn-helix domain-containing protein [Candidatus Altiarchaeota archaeon]
MKLPCEQALWYVLPQIRADIARELIERGMNQKQAAKKLGVTPSAVSQYLNKKRAGKLKLPADYSSLIKDAVEDIIKNEDDEVLSVTICKCCAKSRG